MAILAGEINLRRKAEKKGWGMADSPILATAMIMSAKIATGDRHFEGLAGPNGSENGFPRAKNARLWLPLSDP